MNRVLYQLSYAAMCGQRISAPPKSASSLYLTYCHLSRRIFQFLGNNLFEVVFLKFWKESVLFYLGGMGYVGLELLWRRRSHSSMFVLGGLCFLLLGQLKDTRLRLPLPRAIAGAGMITTLELAAGLLVNRQHQVWNYSGLPLNFMGQICLPFSLLWIPIAALGMGLHTRLSRVVDQSVTSL